MVAWLFRSHKSVLPVSRARRPSGRRRTGTFGWGKNCVRVGMRHTASEAITAANPGAGPGAGAAAVAAGR